MKKTLLLLCICLGASACVTARRPISYVPPEEAAWFKFPQELPREGRQEVPGMVLAAIQLAMDDFLPWSTRPHLGATPREVCLYQRQSYDVRAAPGPAGVVLVRFVVSPGACTRGGPPVMDMGATYAVEVQKGQVLAVQKP